MIKASLLAMALAAAAALAVPTAASAQASRPKAEAMECKSIADPKMKDECVRKSAQAADKAAAGKEKGAAMKAEKGGGPKK